MPVIASLPPEEKSLAESSTAPASEARMATSVFQESRSWKKRAMPMAVASG